MQNFTAKEIHRISLGLPPWESMSFACGGWLQCYMFGVIKALQSKGLDKGVTYCGCSAGSLAAAGIALNCDPDVAIQYIKEDCIPKAYRSVNGLFQLKKYISDCFDKCIGPNYNESHFSELQVAITKLPFFTGERVSQYNSIDELKNALVCI
jgi:predicted acylesterase/phospholipase RssA